jgi:hypothetical protein
MDRRNYDGNGGNSGSNSSSSGENSSSGSRNYTEMPVHMDLRDPREGKSHMMRRAYMESKEMHKDKAS